MDMREVIVGSGAVGVGAAVYGSTLVAAAIAPFLTLPLILAGAFTLIHGLVEGEEAEG